MRPILAICFDRSVRRAFCCGVAVAALAACGGREHVPTTLFAGPGQMALAGERNERVFVANRGTDSVQVLALTPNLETTDFVQSAARYFPLHLPVGTEPTEIASAGQGHYVFVLDAIDNTVSVIDAEKLEVLPDATGARMRVTLGDPQGQARGIVGHALSTCTATHALEQGTCIARAYVTQKALGTVAVVDLRQASNGVLALVVDDTIVVGGAPEALTMGPTQSLFVTDDAAPSLVRVRLSSDGSQAPVIERFGIDAIAGSVAVTQTAVAVTRPSLGDVVVLGVTGDATASIEGGTLSIRDGNPTLAPVPRCLAKCSDPPATCAAAHPADRALCVDENGYATPTNVAPYAGLPTQGVPRALTALRADALAEPFSVKCTQGTQTIEFSSGFAVASFHGAVEFIGIGEDGAPHMIDAAFCQAPTLADVPNAAAPISTLLSSCLPHPDRNRFACATTDNEAGALIMRGQMKERIGLQWEGVLPLGEGEAVIDAQGQVHRAERDALDFAGVPLLESLGSAGNARGDVFEVTSRPHTEDSACQAALAEAKLSSEPSSAAAESLCIFERRIVGRTVAAAGDPTPTTLQLDAPLPAACFPHGVRYRLRVGDAFLVGRLNALEQLASDGLARVAPGAKYGQPVAGVLPLPIAFALREDLDPGVVNACQRYQADGRSADPKAPWRSRALPSGFLVSDPARTLQMAANFDATGRAVGRIGFLPHALLFVPSTSPGGTRLLVSYAGSNALYATPAQNSRDVTGEGVAGRGRLFTN